MVISGGAVASVSRPHPPYLEKPPPLTVCDSSLLPVIKPWGCQRRLRCVKHVDQKSLQTQLPARVESSSTQTVGTGADDGRLERVREKLTVKLRMAAEKICSIIETAPAPREKAAEERPPAPELPWKLRTRGTAGHQDRPSPEGAEKSTDRTKRRKFSVVLSREEVDEDLFSLTGKRASKRPKKRPRPIKNQLDQLFPGSCLTEVTPAMYKVRPPPPSSES